MALIQTNFLSKSLMRTVTFNAIVPCDKLTFPGMPVREKKSFKTLYLLHGIFGNYTDWLSGTRIQAWAEERDLAVIMPSGDNAFYVDNERSGAMYGEFIGKELVEFTRELLPLSDRREDTFIAGLSMGGYGAIRNGLKYHNTFGAIAGLSAAFVLEEALSAGDRPVLPIGGRDFFGSVFGDLSQLLNSDKNPKWLAEQLKSQGTAFPDIYLCCGTEDFLLTPNREFHSFLDSLGIAHTYAEGPGGHDWVFWDTFIKNILDWLPLETPFAGVSSGNVGG